MKTVTIVLCAIAIATAMYLKAGAQNPQLASPACVACRDSCVKAREQCKDGVCRSQGMERDTPQACKGTPRNQKAFEDGLRACETQEKACWAQCDKGACR